ncbi:MAG: hypothetical protein JWM44_4049 [Bacilli bacterium]|nr:hypothetical protein [Bacilli bacterium]
MARRSKGYTVGEKIFVISAFIIGMYLFCAWFFPMAFQHMIDGLKNWPSK